MAIIKQVQIETNGIKHDIGAKYDEQENEISSTYATSLTKSSDNNTINLKSRSDNTLSSISIDDATYTKHGLMSVSDKQKLDEFYLANAYATTAYVDQLISEQTDITAYKGVVSFDTTDNRWESDDGTVWPPASPQNGWTYKVGTQGTPTGLSESCNVGDFLIYSTSGGAHWARIGGSNSEGSLYKKSPYTAGQMLLADDNLGAVKSVDIAPTVTLGTPSTSAGQTITISVGGQSGTLQQSATLSQATTSQYGVTKLTSTVNLNSTENGLAVTPAGVSNALQGIVASPITEIYTLLPESSSESIGTNIFKWSGNSIEIINAHITANSYEIITIAPAAATNAEEIAVLNQACITSNSQINGKLTLVALGQIPSITTHIQVTHNYSSSDITTSVNTAAAEAARAQGYANQAAAYAKMQKRTVALSSTSSDGSNAEYPYKYEVTWQGVSANDWVDASGVTNQDWSVESAENKVILHFTQAITSVTSINIYWEACEVVS